MRKVLWCLFTILIFTLTAVPLFAAAESIMVGQVLKHNLSVCVEKKDAIAIVEAEIKGGYSAAEALWNENPKCGNTDVVGPTVGNVVHTGDITRGDRKLKVSVVEIVHEGKVIGYFLTSGTITAKRDIDS